MNVSLVRVMACCAAAGVAALGCRSTQPARADEARTTRSQERYERTEDGDRAPAGMVSQAMAYPTGDRDTSVILLRTTAPEEITVGKPFDYALQVTNLTDETVQNVVVRERFPGNFEISSADPQPERGPEGAAQFLLGDLPGGASQTILITGVATDMGNLVSCAEVDWNRTLCLETQVVNPQLQLALQAEGSGLVCDGVRLNGRITNDGTGTARNVVIHQELPQGIRTADGADVLNLDVGDLAAGESRDFSFELVTDRPGELTPSLVATAEGDLRTEASAEALVLERPAVTVEIEAREEQFVGADLVHTYTVANTSEIPATQVRLAVQLPQGAEVTGVTQGGRAEGNQVVFDLGTLPPGETRQLQTRVVPRQKGDLAVRAELSAYCADAARAEAATTVTGIPAILLEVIDEKDPVQIGTETRYRIEVTNQGSADDSNITIECELPAGFELVSTGGATPGTGEGQTIRFEPLPLLRPGDVVTWTVTVVAREPGEVLFATRMTSDQLKNAVDETEATRLYE